MMSIREIEREAVGIAAVLTTCVSGRGVDGHAHEIKGGACPHARCTREGAAIGQGHGRLACRRGRVRIS